MENNFEIEELVFEASAYRSSILKDIDNNFSELKKDTKNIAAKKELVINIKKFTNTNYIAISIKPNYFNAAVIPIYKQMISADVINLFKDYQVNGNIRNLEIVEEPSKYIDKLYIIIGKPMFTDFSPRELTAILLHELGHSFTYTSNLPRIILSVFDKIFFTANTTVNFFISPGFLSAPIIISSFIISFIVMRSLTFLEHKSEYRADQFAAKYGYGDEIIKVLYKFKLAEKAQKQSWFKKVFEFIKTVLLVSTHPSNSKRIKELNNSMINDYKRLYPKLSKELNIILQDI
jgi:hypothetical protein